MPYSGSSKYRVPLSIPSYGDEEIDEVIDTLRSGKVTLGDRVERFESMWASYVVRNMRHGKFWFDLKPLGSSRPEQPISSKAHRGGRRNHNASRDVGDDRVSHSQHWC